MNYRPVKAYIDLEALKSNLNQVRAFAPQAKIISVIKANGYGHGMLRVAEQLSSTDAFGVASIDEAIKLRHKGFLHRIILLEGLFSEAEFSLVIQHRLDFVIHSDYQLDWLIYLNSSNVLNIWIKIDTGMHRLGFLPETLPKVHLRLKQLKVSPVVHYMSHFASADESVEFTQQQFEMFNELTKDITAPKSLANSAAIQNFPISHLDWVRPGIMLYGAGNLDESKGLKTKDLKTEGLNKLIPVMTLVSEITSLKWIEAGEAVGYGQTWKADRRSLIGVVAIGYGDGYPRHAPTGTPVLIQGKKVPIVGCISMDMITINLTDFNDKIEIGETVILWGKDLSVDLIAKYAGTISYELLCGVTQRVPIIDVRSPDI